MALRVGVQVVYRPRTTKKNTAQVLPLLPFCPKTVAPEVLFVAPMCSVHQMKSGPLFTDPETPVPYVAHIEQTAPHEVPFRAPRFLLLPFREGLSTLRSACVSGRCCFLWAEPQLFSCLNLGLFLKLMSRSLLMGTPFGVGKWLHPCT